MDYKDFIKPGTKCIHIPDWNYADVWQYAPELFDPQVVTIGEYKPYYTDGTPDPTPEEYDERCFVEIEGYTSYDESQVALRSLLPIIEEKNGKKVLYCGNEVKVFGADEDNDYYVIETDGKLKVVNADEVDVIRHIPELSRRELQELRKQISVGSIYLSDYYNTLGVPKEEASSYAEGYLDYLQEEFGEDWESHDTPEMFDYYCS